MSRQLVQGMSLACVLLLGTPVIAGKLDNKVFRDLSQAEVERLIRDAGGSVEQISANAKDGFTIDAVFPGGMPLHFAAMDCKADSGVMRCPEYELMIDFEAASPEAAQKFDHERQIEFVADGSDGATYKIWRMGFLYGGVTQTYVLDEMMEVVDLGWEVSGLFPFKEGRKPKGPKPENSGKLFP